MTLQRVLVPLDGSEFSRQILSHIKRFLDPATCELILLRVAPSVQGMTPSPPQPTLTEWREMAYPSHRDAVLAKHPIYANQMQDSLEANLHEAMQDDLRDLFQVGYKVYLMVKFGDDPAGEIMKTIDEEQIDLVAMTTHGRTGLSRLIFGSVAEKVLHKVAVPIILFRPTAVERPQHTPNGVTSLAD